MYEYFFENQIPTPLRDLNSQPWEYWPSHLPLSYQSLSNMMGYILVRLSICYTIDTHADYQEKTCEIITIGIC